MADANVANPPVVADDAKDDPNDGDTLMAEANLGNLTGDASNGEFDHAYNDNVDRTKITTAEAEIDHSWVAETHDQGEDVFKGDSKVQAVIGSTPAGHDEEE